MSKTLTKARAALVLSQPFFGSLALRLKLAEATHIDTLAVDGETLFYNPAYVDGLSFDEVVGVIGHEVLHCAMSHHVRRGARDHKRWNVACDFAINGILLGAGFRLPDGALHRPPFDGLSAEQVYDLLEQPENSDGEGTNPNCNQDGGNDGADPGRCGAVIGPASPDGTSASPADLAKAEADWQIATLQAAQFAKAAGRLPAAVDRFVDDMRRPRIDWRAALRRFVTATVRQDYSWSRPNRRYVASGLYLPSMETPGLGRLVIAVDTSGSIDDETLAQFAAEMNAIVEDAKPDGVDVVYCDADVARVERFDPHDLPLTLNPKGRGGTSFRPPFEWVEAEGALPACLIYLTDLYGDFPDPPAYPVLWASTTDEVAPFGERVKI
ncbi:MAG: VWA-like domain-containing protein [Pseudomonadota bacterium]